MPVEFEITAMKIGDSLRMTTPETVKALALKERETALVSLADSTIRVNRYE
jgi:hypothetical protein